MLRLIVRHTDTSNMSPYGGTHITTFKTFVVDLPEVERLLRDNSQYSQHQVMGVEILTAPAPSTIEQELIASLQRAADELSAEGFDVAAYRALIAKAGGQS